MERNHFNIRFYFDYWVRVVRVHSLYLLFLLFVFYSYTVHAVDFNMSTDKGCTGVTGLNVGLEVIDIVPDSTIWNFGDGTTAKGNSLFKTYTNNGVFTIIMTTYKDGVPTVVTKNITVHKSPAADFEFDKLAGCPPLLVNFTDKSTEGNAPIEKRTWGFANGIVLQGNNTAPSQTFNAVGARDISLIVEDQNGCSSSKTYPAAITVYARPVVDFEFYNSNSCELPVETVFNNKSDSLNVNSFSWDFGDGGTSVAVSPSHLYTTEGTFAVKLTATDSKGCTNEKVLSNMIVDEEFTVDISFTDTVGCDILDTRFQPVISSLYRSLSWTIDPRLTVDMSNMRITSNELGTYPVKLEATSQFGCTITKVRNVYVVNKPVVDFSATPLLSCSSPQSIQFTNLTQFADTYRWAWGDGTFSSVENPTKIYSNKSTYNISLVARNNYGCTTTHIKSQYVKILEPEVLIEGGNFQGCAPLNSQFSARVVNNFTISNIQWNFGNGNVFTGINPPAQVYNSAGVFTVTAIVSFVEGCNNVTVTRTINVGSPQNITASISGTEICPGTLLTGDAVSLPNATYEWSIGNITKVSGRTFSYKFTQSGTFPINVDVISNGCKSTRLVGNVTVKPTAANFIVVSYCSGLRVNFRNNNNQGTESTWDFGDGTIKRDDNRVVTHDYKSYGKYNIKLTVYNPTTGCRDEIIKEVNVTKSKVDGFTLNPVKGCAPLEVSYNSFSNTGFNNWYINGELIRGSSIKHNMNEVGVYNLILVNIEDNCKDSIFFKDLIQVIKPDAGFKFDPIGGCSPITVNFEDTSKSALSTINQYNWKIGNITTRTEKQFSHTFSLTAIIPISLFIEDNFGCKDTAIHNVIVARPFAEFQLPSASFCTGNAFKPVNQSTGVGLTYMWDFGDGSPIVTDSAPQHIYKEEGVYDIELKIIDANNCESVKRVSNAVTIQDIEYDFTAFPTSKHCPPLLTDFSVIPANITYRRTQWDFGNGTVLDDTTRAPKYLYMTAGVFDVTLTLEDYRGCTEVIKKEKLIDIGGPSGEFNVISSGSCAPVEAIITADIKNSVANFWNYGDGNGKFDRDAHSESKHIYQEPGVYSPSVTVDDGMGCLVTVNGPEIYIGGVKADAYVSTDIVCTAEELTVADTTKFQSHSPFKSRFWSFSDGFTSSDSLLTRNIATTDSMELYIQLQVEDSIGCKDISIDTVRVFAKAPLEVVGELVICKGDTIQLTASRVHYYEWNASGSLDRTDVPRPFAFPLQTTEYQVRGYVSPTCFTDKTVKVEVRDAFRGEVGTDTILCIGDKARLWVNHDVINSGKFSYQWTVNGSVIDTVANLEITPESSATYMVNVKNGACKDFNAPVTIEVREYPELTVSEPGSILSGQEIKLEAFSDVGSTYSWIPAPDAGCPNCPFAFVSPRTTTTYTVTVSRDGCEVSEDVTVNVTPGCNEDMIEIQNVFTPNHDGINDFFTLSNNQRIELNKLRIYARTGELVFESSNIRDSWDGTFNGTLLNTGVYVYYLDAQCKNGEPLLLKGNVTLLR